MNRLLRALALPFQLGFARIAPEKYARWIGVRAAGNLSIYGSSYGMFSTEPWLVTLGADVHIVGGTLFLPHDGGTLILRHEIPDLELTKPISVGSNVYIGAKCMIMAGVEIGSNVIIGAGAVVTRNIPDNSVAVGVPARVVKTLEEYKKKAIADSLHLGHLNREDKEKALKKIFKISNS